MNLWALARSAIGSALLASAIAAPAAAQVSYAPGPNNPAPSNESAAGTGIPAIQIRVTVSGTEAAVIQSLTIDNKGTVDDLNDISAAHLWLDANGNGWVDAGDTALSSNQTYTADDGSVVFSNLGHTIGVGGSEDWLMVVDLAGTASSGEHFTAHLGGAQTITAVGASSGLALTVTGVSVNSGAKQIDPAHCTLSVQGAVVLQPTSGALPGATAFPMALLELRASTAQAIVVSSITFTASGTGNDLSEVSQVRLFRDANGDGALQTATDPEIGGSLVTYNMDDGTAVFATLNETVPVGGRLFLILAYDFATTAVPGNTFGVSVASSSDITRTGTAVPAHTHSTTTSCQLHGTPTTHTPTTLQSPTTPPPPPPPPPGGTTTTDPNSPKARPHTPSYCCAAVPALVGGGGTGGAGGLGAGLMLWWPLLLLAACCWVVRDRRRLALARRGR